MDISTTGQVLSSSLYDYDHETNTVSTTPTMSDTAREAITQVTETWDTYVKIVEELIPAKKIWSDEEPSVINPRRDRVRRVNAKRKKKAKVGRQSRKKNR